MPECQGTGSAQRGAGRERVGKRRLQRGMKSGLPAEGEGVDQWMGSGLVTLSSSLSKTAWRAAEVCRRGGSMFAGGSEGGCRRGGIVVAGGLHAGVLWR